MRGAVLIYNPKAGRWRAPTRLAAVVDALADSGYRAEALPTSGPGDATRIARRAAHKGVEFVFALGGDGTLREAAAGLLGSAAVLGPLPAGTSNVIARSLGISLDPLRAARSMGLASPWPLRVGLCADEPFLMQVSAGLDARALAATRPAAKRQFGAGAVAFAAVREWLRYDYPEISLSADGQPLQATFCAACNISQYGPFQLAPMQGDEGQITLVAFAGAGRRETLSFAWDLARGRHLQRHDVRTLRAESVTLEGPDDLLLQLDGCVSSLEPPVTVRVASSRLPVLRP